MKIYVCHSGDFDFRKELYQPLRLSPLNDSHELILPHEDGSDVNTREMIKSVDAVIAEISYPSTGQGIELGWSNAFEKPIIAVYKKDSDYSSSTRYIAEEMVEYKDLDEMVNLLQERFQ